MRGTHELCTSRKLFSSWVHFIHFMSKTTFLQNRVEGQVCWYFYNIWKWVKLRYLTLCGEAEAVTLHNSIPGYVTGITGVASSCSSFMSSAVPTSAEQSVTFIYCPLISVGFQLHRCAGNPCVFLLWGFCPLPVSLPTCPLLRASHSCKEREREKKQKPRLMSAKAFAPHSDSHKLNAGICQGRDGI